VHEVVNGLLSEGPGDDVPALGILALGSGCDYIRTFGIPNELDEAVSRLADAEQPRTVDVGQIRYTTGDGEAIRHFCNIAGAGVGPQVVHRASRLPRGLGCAVYIAGFWLELPRFTRRPCTVELGIERFEGEAMNIVVALGKVFGGGMRIAPNADPSDGLFDVQIHKGSKFDYVRGITKVYKGTHLPRPTIEEASAAEVRVDCDPPALVEADGELL
jgi:diacylglycerol kinase (ATP)